MVKFDKLWLGSEDSFIAAIELVNGKSELRIYRDEEPSGPWMLDVQGSTAIVNINGPLISQSNELIQRFGIANYPDIQDALITAAQDESIDNILLSIDSPGGSANGLGEVSDLINTIKQSKPVIAYTGGTMASAAYWIGASADAVYASKLASVGSIGVIATHFDVTKQLEMEGVKATVFRSGEFKALGGPYEELTPEAKKVIQDRIDKLHNEFVNHIAMSRDMSPVAVRETLANGKEYLGYEAQQIGMVDKVVSATELPKLLNKWKGNSIKLEDDMAKRKLLDEKTVAVIAAGGEVDVALESAPVADEPEVVASTEVPEPSTKELALEAQVSDTLTEYLQGQVAALQQKTMDLEIDKRALQSKVDAMSATHNAMREIVASAVSVKRIALGHGATDLSSVGDEALVQMYSHITEEFNRTFPVGGKCQAPSTDDEVKLSVVPNTARVKAAKIK